jgi:hypothetical protein
MSTPEQIKIFNLRPKGENHFFIITRFICALQDYRFVILIFVKLIYEYIFYSLKLAYLDYCLQYYKFYYMGPMNFSI